MKPDSFIDDVLRLYSENKKDDGMDLVFDHLFIDGSLSNEEVDEVLLSPKLEQLEVEVIVGVLTATLSRRNKLKNREAFYLKCYSIFDSRGIDKERTKKILSGLGSNKEISHLEKLLYNHIGVNPERYE